MSDIIIHLLIPLLILLLVCDKDKHIYIYILLPIALVPDVDVLYEHRALLHNLFIPLVLIFASTLTIGRAKIILIISSIYLYSHAILDIFNGGVQIFYPLYNKMFAIRTDIVLINNFNIRYFIEAGFRDGYAIYPSTINIISTEGMGILVLTIFVFSIRKYLNKEPI